MNTKRNLTGKALITYKENLKLSNIQREIIIGTLLGDATMPMRGGKPVYGIKFEQGEAHKDYLFHLYEILEPFVGTSPSERYIDKAKTRKSFWFRTYRHKQFIFYFNLFYKTQPDTALGRQSPAEAKTIKIVPKNIHKFLTPRAVAYWFMDDGTYHIDQRSKIRSYAFSTQGFQKYEVERLCSALNFNFKIKANVAKDKDKWRIYILRESSQTLIELISPYIHKDFLYKL
jgi:hypothetical protein